MVFLGVMCVVDVCVGELFLLKSLCFAFGVGAGVCCFAVDVGTVGVVVIYLPTVVALW